MITLAEQLPSGAWDVHCHVFGPTARFPFASSRAFTPDDAPAAALMAFHESIGVDRAVVVQASVHGTDHRALLDVLARAEGRYRGVAIVDDEVGDADLDRLDRAGVCGLRCNLVPHLSAAVDLPAVRRAAKRAADRGWHLVLHVAGDQLARIEEIVPGDELPVVIDHIGRVSAADGPHSPAFTSLLRLLENPRFHVKISGPDRVSGVPGWPDAVPLVRAIVAATPDRVLWGSDWPHANTRPLTRDADLLRFFAQAVPEPEVRTRILVANPRRLYG